MNLVHRPAVAVHGVHHAFDHRVEDDTGGFEAVTGHQLEGAAEVREQNRQLCPLTAASLARHQDASPREFIVWRGGPRGRSGCDLDVLEQILGRIDGANAHRLFRRVPPGIRSEQDDRSVGPARPGRPQHLQTAAIGHAEIVYKIIETGSSPGPVPPRVSGPAFVCLPAATACGLSAASAF
jgi:hypothetical protein